MGKLSAKFGRYNRPPNTAAPGTATGEKWQDLLENNGKGRGVAFNGRAGLPAKDCKNMCYIKNV